MLMNVTYFITGSEENSLKLLVFGVLPMISYDDLR